MPKGVYKHKIKAIDTDMILKYLQNGDTVKIIAKKLNVSRETIYHRLKMINIQNTQQFKFNHNFFECIDTEEKAYWLGFITADGCVSMTANPKVDIGLAIIDITHLYKWHKILRSTKKINVYMNRAISSHPSKKMCYDLIKVGCTPQKSLTLKFPKLKNDLVRHYIRGYMDGDGCISFGNKNQAIWQIKLNFLGTQEFLFSLQNKIGTNVKIRKKKNISILEINGNTQVMNILDFLYKDATVFLDRKYNIYNEHKKLLESR